MGLSVVLIGHINFLLGALVHGVVLRHINLHKQARAMEYAISNVIALTSGLVVSARWTDFAVVSRMEMSDISRQRFNIISVTIPEISSIFVAQVMLFSFRAVIP